MTTNDLPDIPQVWYIPVKNGTLITHLARDIVLGETNTSLASTIPHDFHADAPPPAKFLAFIDDFCGGDQARVNHILEIMGYFMLPANPYKKAWLIHGPSASGKTSLVRILAGILGHENCERDCLMINSRMNEALPAALENKLILYTGQDEKPRKLYNTIVKMMTGNEYMKAHERYARTMRLVKVTWKLVVVTQHEDTVIPARDSSFKRRWVVDRAEPSIREREPLDIAGDILADPIECQGILKLMVDGLGRLMARGGFSEEEGTSA